MFHSAPVGPNTISADPPDRFRVLLVEDHQDTAEVLRLVLSRRGYLVTVARCKADALDRMAENAADLLVCDIGLPDGNGIEVLRAFRQLSSAPAIAVSGFGTDEDRHRHLDSGFNRHLTKPFGVVELLRAIDDLVVEQVAR